MSNKETLTQNFIIGRRYIKKDKKEEKNSQEGAENIYLTDKTREGSLMVIGTKGSGKSSHMMPMFFKQDLKRKDMGITVVCGTKDIAYTLYTMAKMEKRKVILLKPSTNSEVLNSLITANKWDYEYINDHIINYKKAIKDKAVVIIDMEYDFYRQDAIRSSAMLLLQLQTDMCLTQETKKQRHSVYIDDAQNYLPFIDMLIKCGNNYNIINTLFFQGRNQFKIGRKDYTALIDNNVQSTILMNNINFDDAKYYAEKLCPAQVTVKSYLSLLMHMPYATFTYDIQGSDYKRKVGSGILAKIPEDEMENIVEKAIRTRKKLVKYNKESINTSLLQPEVAELYYLTPKKIRENTDEKDFTSKNRGRKKPNKETVIEEKNDIENFAELSEKIEQKQNDDEKQVEADVKEIMIYQEQEENKKNNAVEEKKEVNTKVEDVEYEEDIDSYAQTKLDQNYENLTTDDMDEFMQQMSDAINVAASDPVPEEKEQQEEHHDVEFEEEFDLDGQIEISNISASRVNRPIMITFPNLQRANSVISRQNQYNKMFNNMD